MARVCARLIFVVLAYGTNAAHGQPFLRRTAASSRRLLEGNEYNDELSIRRFSDRPTVSAFEFANALTKKPRSGRIGKTKQ